MNVLSKDKQFKSFNVATKVKLGEKVTPLVRLSWLGPSELWGLSLVDGWGRFVSFIAMETEWPPLLRHSALKERRLEKQPVKKLSKTSDKIDVRYTFRGNRVKQHSWAKLAYDCSCQTESVMEFKLLSFAHRNLNSKVGTFFLEFQALKSVKCKSPRAGVIFS